MPRLDLRYTGPALRPALAPEQQPIALTGDNQPYSESAVDFDGGTGRGAYPFDPEVALWNDRFLRWRDEFNKNMAPKLRKYWRAWKSMDDTPPYSPGSEWRERGVLPSVFKWIETRLPRKIMALFGAREYFTVEAVNGDAEDYEEIVRELITSSLEDVGSDNPGGRLFMERMIDGIRYGEIMGHVWWKVWWRDETRSYKTKIRVPSPEGKVKWLDAEGQMIVYSNVDIDWLPLDSLAVDLNPTSRRWAIERILTTYEALERENSEYRKSAGEDLYQNLDALSLSFVEDLAEAGYKEPRDTEGWPLEEPGNRRCDRGEHPCELWLCWDNDRKTLTKLVNRSVVIDHGLSPTPDGLDPYLRSGAIPVPGQVYMESILNWILDLAKAQTKLHRARFDEVMLGIFQQFVFREGSITNNKMLLRPGGGIAVANDGAPDRPVTADFNILQRREVLPSAWQEEGYLNQQGESASAADPVSQGVEATQKSRDVTATEVQQRILQGSGRYQLENLYLEVSFKKPLLYKVWNLLRQNLTNPRIVRVVGDDGMPKEVRVDLTDLQRAVDIKVGGGVYELTNANRGNDVQELVNLAASPVFGPILDPQPILKELFRIRDWKRPNRFLKGQQQVADDQRQELLKQLALKQGAGAPGGEGPGPVAGPNPTGADFSPMSGMPGAGEPSGVSGEEPPAAARPGGKFEEF